MIKGIKVKPYLRESQKGKFLPYKNFRKLLSYCKNKDYKNNQNSEFYEGLQEDLFTCRYDSISFVTGLIEENEVLIRDLLDDKEYSLIYPLLDEIEYLNSLDTLLIDEYIDSKVTVTNVSYDMTIKNATIHKKRVNNFLYSDSIDDNLANTTFAFWITTYLSNVFNNTDKSKDYYINVFHINDNQQGKKIDFEIEINNRFNMDIIAFNITLIREYIDTTININYRLAFFDEKEDINIYNICEEVQTYLNKNLTSYIYNEYNNV